VSDFKEVGQSKLRKSEINHFRDMTATQS